MKKAIKILVEYDDGSSSYAEGDAATQIWNWLLSGESMNLIHGAVYSGPKFEERNGN